MKYQVKICDGMLDGITFEVPFPVEKIIVQFDEGKTLRYENDVREISPDLVELRMVESRHTEEFDEELKIDEEG